MSGGESTFSQSVYKQTLRLPCISSRPLPLRAASIGNGCCCRCCLAVWLFGSQSISFSLCLPKKRGLCFPRPAQVTPSSFRARSRSFPLFLSLPQLGFSRRPAPRAPGAHRRRRRRRRTSSAARLPSLLCQLLFCYCCCSTSEVTAAEITAATRREARLPFLVVVLVLCMCVFLCVCVFICASLASGGGIYLLPFLVSSLLLLHPS